MLKEQQFSPKTSFPIALGVAVAILALVIASFYHAAPPSPVSDSAALGLFSSARALTHLQHIAQKPHPIGTPENAAVRNYLVAELQALGLEPQIQKTLAITRSHH